MLSADRRMRGVLGGGVAVALALIIGQSLGGGSTTRADLPTCPPLVFDSQPPASIDWAAPDLVCQPVFEVPSGPTVTKRPGPGVTAPPTSNPSASG